MSNVNALTKRTFEFLADRRGNIALLTAFVMPALLLAAGAGIDFSRWSLQRASLKEVSDLLATRGAREFLLANATEANIKAVIDAAVANNIGDGYGLGSFSHVVDVDMVDASVTVRLVQTPKTGLILTKFFPYNADIDMQSTAVARGGTNVCVVALNEHDKGAITAFDDSDLNAPECAMYSNSTASKGIDVMGAAKLTASLICSGGGYGGNMFNFDPSPVTDCPAYEDPLKDREPPTVGMCDYYDKSVGEDISELKAKANLNADLNMLEHESDDEFEEDSDLEFETLDPGVYCGGLVVGSDADVTLSPGTYIIKDGPLAVGLGGKLTGTGVSFYLVGDEAIFHFDFASKITLSAEESGALAGLLFFEDRNAPQDRIHRIMSDDARELIGTFYLPRGEFRVASLLPVADKSAYTAIVARKLSMAGSPTLVLNADYDQTTVPVPAGVGPVGGGTYLRD